VHFPARPYQVSACDGRHEPLAQMFNGCICPTAGHDWSGDMLLLYWLGKLTERRFCHACWMRQEAATYSDTRGGAWPRQVPRTEGARLAAAEGKLKRVIV
jgi:hypothetical protein